MLLIPVRHPSAGWVFNVSALLAIQIVSLVLFASGGYPQSARGEVILSAVNKSDLLQRYSKI